MRQRVSVQALQTTQDAQGAPLERWIELCQCWASVEPGTGTERWTERLDREVVQRPYRIRMRYRDDVAIDEHCQVVWGEHRLDVVSVADQQGRGRELVLVCDEAVKK